MRKEDKGKTAKEKRQEPSEDRVQAATLAVRHLISPDESKLVEVSYLSIGMVHSLTMLQAYEEHIATLIEQIREMQKWYIRRALRRKYGDDWQSKQRNEIVEGNETIETEYDILLATLDSIDIVESKELFIHRFRHSLYQHSRGKDGKFIESLTILADTDLQTRSPDLEDAFRSNVRGQ